MAWYHTYPIPESQQVAGMVSFYNEHVDIIHVDGEEEPRPRAPFTQRSATVRGRVNLDPTADFTASRLPACSCRPPADQARAPLAAAA